MPTKVIPNAPAEERYELPDFVGCIYLPGEFFAPPTQRAVSINGCGICYARSLPKARVILRDNLIMDVHERLEKAEIKLRKLQQLCHDLHAYPLSHWRKPA